MRKTLDVFLNNNKYNKEDTSLPIDAIMMRAKKKECSNPSFFFVSNKYILSETKRNYQQLLTMYLIKVFHCDAIKDEQKMICLEATDDRRSIFES